MGEHGRGGLGHVLRAYDKDLERVVAIKELLQPLAFSQARFVQEARITARLEHPGIVPVHDAGSWPDGRPFYAMKLVDGRPLKEVMAEASTFESRLGLISHLIAIADAVGYAHARGVVHRDLKPSNILIGQYGETIVIDWGLAKFIGGGLLDPEHEGESLGPADRQLTAFGGVVGTPSYMAPEQARGEACNYTADVFALGAMLYELLAGHPPHQGETVSEIIEKARTTAPVSVRLAAPRVGPELGAIVDRALDVAPAQRFATASGFADDLRRFASGQLVHSHRYGIRTYAGYLMRRYRALVVGTGAVLLVALILGAVAIVGVARERDVAIRANRLLEERAARLTLAQAEAVLNEDPARALELVSGIAHNFPDMSEEATDLAFRAISAGPAERSLRIHPQGGYDVALSSHGDAVATVGYRGEVSLGRSSSTSPSVVELNPRYVTGVLAFGPNDSDLVFIGRDGLLYGATVIANRAVQRTPFPCGSALGAVALAGTPDQRYAIGTESGDVFIAQWRENDMSCALLSDGDQAVVEVRWLNDATDVAVARADGTFEIVRSSGASLTFETSIPSNHLVSLETCDAVSVLAATDGRILALSASGQISSTEVTIGGPLTAIDCSGGVVLAGTAAGTIHLLTPDLREGQVIAPAAGGISAFAVSPDGAMFAAGTLSGTVVVGSTRTGSYSRLVGHEYEVLDMEFGTDHRLHSVARDGLLRTWRVDEETLQIVYRGHSMPPMDVICDRSCTSFLSGGLGGAIHAWNLSSLYSPHSSQRVPESIMRIRALSGDAFIVNGKTGIYRWSAGRGTLDVVGTSDADYTVTAVSQDRGLVLISRSYQTHSWIEVRRAADLQQISRLRFNERSQITHLRFTNHGRAAVFATRSGRLHKVDLGTGQIARLGAHSDEIESLSSVESEAEVVSGSMDHTVRVWDVDSGNSWVVAVHSDLVTRVGRLGTWVVSGDDSGYLQMSLASGGFSLPMPKHDGAIRSIAVHPGGRFIATASRDGTVRLWSVPSLSFVTLSVSRYSADFLHFTESGKLLLLSSDNSIRVWDVGEVQGLIADARRIAESTDVKKEGDRK